MDDIKESFLGTIGNQPQNFFPSTRVDSLSWDKIKHKYPDH